MKVICEDLESFKNSKLQGTKPNKKWYSTLLKYYNLWNFLELRCSIIFSIVKLVSIIILIYRKLGLVGPV